MPSRQKGKYVRKSGFNKRRNARNNRERKRKCHILNMPFEIIDAIFSYTKIDDLASFALASKVSSEMVYFYVQSAKAVKRFDRELNELINTHGDEQYQDDDSYQIASDTGSLLRCATLFKSEKKLLSIAKQIFYNIEYKLESFVKNDVLNGTTNMKVFGLFVHGLIGGQLNKHVLLVHHVMQKVNRIEMHINEVLSSAPGTFPEKEIFIRNYYRSIHIETANEQEKVHWLYTILKNLPYVNQAKLLCILFGPVTPLGLIDWFAPLVSGQAFLPYELLPLAHATRSLYNAGVFSDRSMLTLVREIIVTPYKWDDMNVAHFVMSCGNNILSSYIGSMLASGKYFPLTLFTIHCAVATLQVAKPLDSLINVLLETTLSHEFSLEDGKEFVKLFPACLLHIESHDHYARLISTDRLSLTKTVNAIILTVEKSLFPPISTFALSKKNKYIPARLC